jgi:predicted nucleic acid-binding protein
MSAYCLDTSAYSNFRRGHKELVTLIDRADWIGVPTVTMGELRTGFLLGGRRERNESELEEFLANPVVEVLQVDAQASLHYAEIVADLRRAGTPLPTNDIWVAATAARHGAAVLTCDEHFERIARVGTVLLEPGFAKP